MASNLAGPSGSFRKNNSSDESDKTRGSGDSTVTTVKHHRTDRYDFKEPSEEEASLYYSSFPSQPRLLGRTSSATTPWFYETWPPRGHYYPFGRECVLYSATVSGPVSPHAIHALWESTTRQKVIGALSLIDWTSIDVLRIGRATRAQHDRPVIVSVGVASRAVDNQNVSWSLVSCILGRIRRVLDDDGLCDVECELRVSDVLRAAGPRLTAPLLGRGRILHKQHDDRAKHRTACQTKDNDKHEKKDRNNVTRGTLGLYLAPVQSSPTPVLSASDVPDPSAIENTSENEPVWGLTCHHVVFEDDSKTVTTPAAFVFLSDGR
ncbi:uncharacterized protein SPSK_06464 [Sporothrix schenckii 1099-18]|uniref:Uncharacterized protein n=1 Tax=Sporothrix schenckii 1099-18 TaxID=1397361 RepID=A0A0F2MKA8_SPOSC|nr:uncharacterized protein SPSK_06464 [Sporothrix schenckii 1099-18]KJR89275.1 hypothetical protein SPSK_06464 [Sporothrix schenckii 1099-18]